jgi:putative holliday junction resolvase
MNQQSRVLGIDYGSKRIGLSLSDPLRITARPLETISNSETVWVRLEEIIRREDVQLVVVGMPLNLKGEKAFKGEEVDRFVEKVKTKIRCEVRLWDERFTTAIARRTMIQMGTKRSQRKKHTGTLDAMAAAVMLQGFLDSTKLSLYC